MYALGMQTVLYD